MAERISDQQQSSSKTPKTPHPDSSGGEYGNLIVAACKHIAFSMKLHLPGSQAHAWDRVTSQLSSDWRSHAEHGSETSR
jgi:hypothetical protein